VDQKGQEAREVDSRGKVVREFHATGVQAAVRMGPDNVAVLSAGNKCNLLQELAPGGRVVWQANGLEAPRSLAVCLPLVGLGL
jgi:hypothetical protein